MPVLTITTDWSKNDYYIGTVRGKVISVDASVQLIDISHQVASYNAVQASFLLKACFGFFPRGTVHLIAVNSIPRQGKSLIAFEKDGHFFISADCGYPGLLFPGENIQVVKLFTEKELTSTFATIEIFIEKGIELLKAGKLESVGTLIADYVRQTPLQPVYQTSVINGSVVYIDSFQNAITNISQELFARVGQGKPFTIYVQSNHYTITKINKTYQQSSPGDLLAVFNSLGLLEVAINHGPAAEMFNLEPGSVVRVKFDDKPSQNILELHGG